MSQRTPVKISPTMILIFVSLMATFVYVMSMVFFRGNARPSESSDEKWGQLESVKGAEGMYLILQNDFNYPNFTDKTTKQRTLNQFYSLRAFTGAPPRIPHAITNYKTLTGGSCLGCHKNGGYVPKFKAYAPVTPHPEKENCRQCHNQNQTETNFKLTSLVQSIARRGQAHLPGAPLTLPHSLHLRENCAACHVGPAAVREIRTSHPERVNCMQCHVEQNTEKRWNRK